MLNLKHHDVVSDMSEAGIRVFRVALVVTGALLATLGHGYAQTQKGAFEMGIEGGPLLFIASGGHESVGGFLLSVEPHVAYFLTDGLAVGGTGFFFRAIESDPSQPALSYGGAFGHINYHFNPGYSLSPYIGIRIGVFNPDAETQLAVGAQAGLLCFVSRQVSINGLLEIGTSGGSGGNVFLAGASLGLSFHVK